MNYFNWFYSKTLYIFETPRHCGPRLQPAQPM